MTPNGPDVQQLRATLASRGFAILPARGDLAEAASSPWVFAERLLGERPTMLERQPIRAMPGGRSFASTSRYTPLHSDSQLHLGAPPDVQIMACLRAVEAGGESLLLDTWALLDDLSRDDPALVDALFRAPRRIPFVFGDVFGATVALRGSSLAFTHSPVSPPRDAIAARLGEHLRARPADLVRVSAGEVLVVDNRRMLHGRNAFDDTRREFTRILAWLARPLGEHPGYTELARRIAPPEVSDAPLSVRARFGAVEAPGALAADRLRVVLAMLQGAPPGVLSHREGVAEPVLYQWRDAAIAAALQALAGVEGDDVSPRCEARLTRPSR